jgi:glycosidase
MKKAILAALFSASFLVVPALAQNTNYKPKPFVQVKNAPWLKDAVIYQLNTRQFSQEGTFKAAQKELPRIKAMGVDIIWLMPIHPIGVKNRKGSLGSPYSIKDYYEVNPEFGTKADLKNFVDAAHKQGMRVILDLVANHTAWDNELAKTHPDFYDKDWKGNFHPTPWFDWSDIIDLNYDNPKLRKYMTQMMVYWVKNYGIDGYRADVAGAVPTDFWENARQELDKIKPVFMLGEWQQRDLHRNAFDATYAWDWHKTAKNVAQSKADATAFHGYYSESESSWPLAAIRLNYIENHDSNSWEGTVNENFGQAQRAMMALQFVAEGIPMIYNGQEACNNKRLEFFEKDAIKWQKCDYDSYLTKLSAYKTANSALHNGKWGARMIKVENNQPQKVFSFVRKNTKNKVLAVFNFSKEPVKFSFNDELPLGTYKDFDNNNVVIDKNEQNLPAWGFAIYSQN